jgi:hypothetical protein
MPPRIDPLTKDIRTIRSALRQILKSFDRLAAATARAQAAGPAPPRKKLRLSPQRRAALKLQGQYIGHMRSLGPRQRAKVKKVRAAKGIRAAIAAAKRLAA